MNAFKSVFGACVLELSVLLQPLQLRYRDKFSLSQRKVTSNNPPLRFKYLGLN